MSLKSLLSKMDARIDNHDKEIAVIWAVIKYTAFLLSGTATLVAAYIGREVFVK